MEKDHEPNNEWDEPSPQLPLDHFDPIPPGTIRFFMYAHLTFYYILQMISYRIPLMNVSCDWHQVVWSPMDVVHLHAGTTVVWSFAQMGLRPFAHQSIWMAYRASPQWNYNGFARVLSRTIMILTLVFLSGGHVHLEQPQNAMSWLEPVAQSFIRHIAFHCVVIAACCYDANWDKAWLFATSWDKLQSLAGTCQHSRGSHESVVGARDADGSFRSRKTAEYPKQLASSIANLVFPLLSQNSLDLSLTAALKYMPIKSLQDFPFSSEDGGGIHSTPDWSMAERTSEDVFRLLKQSLFEFIFSKNLHKEFLANIANKLSDPPFSDNIVDEARQIMGRFLQQHSKPADWTIREHQPMYVSIMHSLQFFMPNEDVPLFPVLIEGVSTGFHSDVQPSGCFPANDKPDLPSTPLSIHLANWQSAEKEPQTTLELVDEEIKQGWVQKFQGSTDDAKKHFSHVAVGRLGVAFSDSRPPRLVVDSSVCGVNDRCKLPERTTLPSAKDVIRCFPLRNNSRELSGFSLDIKSAHKRVVLKESEQGLLGFSLNDSLYFYRVCPFGGTFSAYWWQRLGGWILRFSTKQFGFHMQVGYRLMIICGSNIVTSFHWSPHS